jgi:hypothetical protein
VSPSGEAPRGPEPLDTPDVDAEFRRVAVIAAGDDLVAARTALRRLADKAAAAGRRSAASRALRLSAALDRVLGDTADAVATARRAADLAGDDKDLAAAALDELGEALLALDHAGAAADAFDRAAAGAAAAGLGTAPALRRKQAYALAAAGRSVEAAGILRDLAAASADPAQRAEILVQAAAGAAGTAGARDVWIAAREAIDASDESGGNGALRADLEFVAAAEALRVGNLDAARVHVRAARQHALDGVAPLAYVAAAVAESSLAEHAGDDESAYGSLATGYATLGDLVGRQLSASTFEGPLLDLRRRWGPERFAAAKAAYEATRRRTLGR